MKKYTIRTISTLIIGWVLPHIHRLWNNKPIEKITPFLFGKGKDGKPIKISVEWYVKDIGDLLSFSLLMLTVVMILIPVIDHLKKVQWHGHNQLLIFVTLWYRLFLVILVSSIFDFIHYMVAFRQIEWYFLILNGGYVIMSTYFIQKLWKQ